MKGIKFLVLSAFLFAHVVVWAQLEEKIKSENVISGVIFLDGKEIPGYLKKMGKTEVFDKPFDAPWQFQSEVLFIGKDEFEKTEKIKNKMFQSYSAKEIEGYKYDTTYYESVKYSDMSAVGMNMIAKKVFMQKVLAAKISLFIYYNSPPALVDGSSYQQAYTEAAIPKMVYQVGKEGKLKLVNNLNINKELADCPAVIEKYAKGEYSSSNSALNNKNKFLNNTLFREDVRLAVIQDYNNTCK